MIVKLGVRARSLGSLRSGVQGEQILAVALDHFRVAVAAGDFVLAHRIPIAGDGEAVQRVKPLLVVRVGL